MSATVGYTYDRQADGSTNFEIASRRINGDEATRVHYQYDQDALMTQAGGLRLHRDASNGLLDGTTLLQTGDIVQRNSFGEVLRYQAASTTEPPR